MQEKIKEIVTPNIVDALTKIFPMDLPKNAAITPPTSGDNNAIKLYSKTIFSFSVYSAH